MNDKYKIMFRDLHWMAYRYVHGRKSAAVTVVCVGDGHRPQTAATFAYRTAWQCYSVDPQLRPRIYNIKRLSLHRCKVEEFGFHEKKNVLLVCVHSHAPLDKAVQSITNYNQLAIISIPCCVHQKIDRPPDLVYRDENIHSPKNEVLVWKSIEEK